MNIIIHKVHTNLYYINKLQYSICLDGGIGRPDRLKIC
jgi:hypothetical protein